MDFTLTTRSRTGTSHTFTCTLDEARTPGTWAYHVRAAGSADFYEARFVVVGAGVVQPDVLDNRNLPEYRGRGITNAIFARVVRDSGCMLISSTNRGRKNLPAESRSASADTVWRRLVQERLAVYDSSIDRYEYLPPLRVRDIDLPQLQDRVLTGFPDNQAALRAKVLNTLERGGIVAVVDEEDRVVDELERCPALYGGWTVRLKHT